MEYINEVNLNEAVVHVLDNNADEPIYNEFMLELSDETYEFILKHIQKCLKSEELKYAIFNDGQNSIKEFSKNYLNDKGDFLSISKKIAKQLFVIMESHGNIPSCDLMIVSISTEYGPILALLKMDYVKNFTHSIGSCDNKIGIDIVPQFVGLPSGGQLIQKCAFIKQVIPENKFDLMIIDKQNRRDSEDYEINYFTSNFLGCSIIENERDATSNFIKVAENWTRSNLKDNAEAAEMVRTAVKKKLQEEDNIFVNRFANEVFKESKDVAENFLQYAKERGITENVPIDKEYVDKKLKRIRLKIDKDMDVYIDRDTYDDKSKFEVIRNGDGTINIVLKHIKNYIEK
ncbi:nucleoid-associated protein [Clostridium pasteurianum]|uniref:nucleoid-associated protein n=1 Tax=Clostridium pasteurianum TaxID=1501 RepID=UPI00226085A3|nr:nucleoid-associated protein [Clostridium pasteurianum]UZW13224.1 nucleoid-associated protein [Clostridium pasteurianum]